MSDALLYPLLAVTGGACRLFAALSAFIGKKAGFAAGVLADFAAGAIGLSPLPAAVLIFRDGLFTPYVFLFFLSGFAVVSAIARLLSNVRKRKNER